MGAHIEAPGASRFLSIEQQVLLQNRLLNAVEQAVIAVDQEGQIIFWNRHAEVLYGWRAGEVIGRNILEVTPGLALVGEASAILARVQAGESWSGQFVVRHRSGAEIPVAVTLSPIQDESNGLVGVVGVSSDISHYREAEDALRRSEHGLRLAVDLAELGLAEWYLERQEIVLSQEALRLLRLPPDSQPDIHALLAMIHADDRSRVIQIFRRKALQQQVLDLEFRVFDGNGDLRWLAVRAQNISNAQDKLGRRIVVIRDVTAAKEADSLLARYQLLSQRARDIILFIRTDGQIVEANEAAVAAYGYEREALLAMKVHELRTPATRSLVDEQMVAANAGGILFETEHCRRDGTVFPVEVSAIGADIGNERLLLSIVRDISERKQAVGMQHFLHDLNVQIRLLSEPEAIVQTVVAALVTRFEPTLCSFCEVNQAADRVTFSYELREGGLNRTGRSYPLSSFLQPEFMEDARAGRTIVVHDVATDERTAEAYASGYLQRGVRATLMAPLLRNGQWVALLVLATAAPRAWRKDEVALLEEIVARVWPVVEKARAEQALRASEEQLRLVTDNLPSLISYVGADRRFRFVNAAYETWFKRPRRNLIGRLLHEVLGEDTYRQMGAEVDAVLAGERQSFEATIADHRGVAHELLIEHVPHFGPDGQVVGFYALMLDISARKKAERDLRMAAQEQAALLEKLTSLNETLERRVRERTEELERSNRELNQFAYVASHDLKAPLRAISHLATWIEEDAGDVLPDVSREHLERLRSRVKRMEKLLDDLLTYSRTGRTKYQNEKVDIGSLVKNVAELLSPPATFSITYDEAMPTIVTPRVPLELVLRNLIGNSIKHHHHPAGHVHVSVRDGEEFVEFVISDDGPGIQPEFHERIFEMFQTLRPRDQVEGSGMGLAIVKKAVESMGGTVGVESAAGKGAKFRFTWPKHEALQSG